MIELKKGVWSVDTVERVIRSLLERRKLSRARALLSLFYDDYPDLAFELEYASGNYMKALKIYETFSDELKERYKQEYEAAKQKLEKREYLKSFRESLNEYTKGNYQGALSLLGNITKDYPELVEAIALKYEIYKKRGDKEKAKEILQVLKKLDDSHPTLVSSERVRNVRSVKWFEPVVVGLLCVILILNLFVVFTKNHVVDIGNLENGIVLSNEKLNNVEKNLKELKSIIGSFSERIIDSIKDLKSTFYIEIDSLKDEFKKQNETMARIENVLTKMEAVQKEGKFAVKETDLKYVLMPGEEVYKPSTTLDMAKIAWLAGYIMYLKERYDDAIELFEKSLKIVRAYYPKVYFRDDCEYYLALTYYMKGDKKKALNLFKTFVERFPESEYVDDAKIFIAAITGGE